MRAISPISVALGLLAFLAAPRLSAAPSALDYAHAPGMISLLHWTRMPVRVSFVDDGAATPEREQSVLAGFNTWVQATGGAVHYRLLNDTEKADIVVSFDLEPFVPGHPGAVGHTDLRHSGLEMARADMTLATAGVSPDELRLTAAHEFGHALGINGHSDSPDDMMAPNTTRLVRPDGTPLPVPPRTVTPRDLNTLWLCYPRLRPGAALPADTALPNSDTVASHKYSKPLKNRKK